MVIVVVLIFTCSDLGRLAHFVEKRWDARKVKKVSQSIDLRSILRESLMSNFQVGEKQEMALTH